MIGRRLCLISYHTCPLAAKEGKEAGGMNVYVLELSKELVKLGYKVDIFTRCQAKSNPHVVQIIKGLRLMHIAAGPKKLFPKKQLTKYLAEFSKNVKKFVKKENLKYDLIHAHYYMSGLAALQIRDFLSIKKSQQTPLVFLPLVMSFHTLALMKNLVARDELERAKEERITAEELLISEADMIIASSSGDRGYLEYLYQVPKKKIKTISPGYNPQLFKPLDQAIAKRRVGANSDHKIVLFVGRIEPLKGIDNLLYAIKILTQKNQDLDLCLWIVGGDISPEGDQRWSTELQKLEKIRKLLKIRTQVTFVGRRLQEDLPYYYNAAEVVVMPSHYESFGMAALEAMACAVPVLTTDAAGVAEIFKKSRDMFITSVNNPLKLAEQIESIVSDKKERVKLGKKARTQVKSLTWKKVAAEMDKAYKIL